MLRDINDVCGSISSVGLADVHSVGRRSSAHAACLITRAEIMGALERDVMRRIGCSKEEKCSRYARRVLAVLISPMEGNALDTFVISNVLRLLKNLTSFKLPPTRRIVHVRQRQSLEFEYQCHKPLLFVPGKPRLFVRSNSNAV